MSVYNKDMKQAVFKCNCYVKRSERVNEKHCNGWMHAVLNESPTEMYLAKKERKKRKKKKAPEI